MVKAAGGPERLGQSAAVTLLQWFDLSHEILLVMERPVPSIDLFTFSLVHQPLPEDLVKVCSFSLTLQQLFLLFTKKCNIKKPL